MLYFLSDKVLDFTSLTTSTMGRNAGIKQKLLHNNYQILDSQYLARYRTYSTLWRFNQPKIMIITEYYAYE